MKTSCFIVDDEPLAIKILEKYVQQTPSLQLKGSSTEPLEALIKLQSESIDLLFLDINMPELSGISLARVLEQPPLLVFTTAYPEFAVEGFELEALDYLVKPISFERFLKAVHKATARLDTKAEPTHLAVKADRRLYNIRLYDILYIEAYGDYIKIYTKDQVIIPKETLNNIELQLPASQFLRVHRSYLVALDKIEFLEGNLIQIGKIKIPVGQSYRDELLEKLDNR